MEVGLTKNISDKLDKSPRYQAYSINCMQDDQKSMNT